MNGRTVGYLLAFLALAGCGAGVKPVDLAAPVPDASQRLEYTLPTDGEMAAVEAALQLAIEQTVCLLRSERADECEEPDGNPPACTVRGEAEIHEVVAPAFQLVKDLELTSPSTINAQVHAMLPDVVSTTQVYDARRTHLCREWRTVDGACVAMRVDKIWLLLHAPPAGGPVDRLEVFLAERACDPDPS